MRMRNRLYRPSRPIPLLLSSIRVGTGTQSLQSSRRCGGSRSGSRKIGEGVPWTDCCAVPLVEWSGPVRKIVDVFIRDTLKGSYPVVIECQDRPGEDELVDQVRIGLDRGFYSADDIEVARFVVREGGGR